MRLHCFDSFATVNGHLELLKFLLRYVTPDCWKQLLSHNYKRVSEPRNLNVAADRLKHATASRSLLTLACMTAQSSIVRFLVDNGAEIHPQDSLLPMHAAIRAQCQACISILLEAGANVNISNFGTPTVAIAMWSPSLDVLKLIVNQGKCDQGDLHNDYYFSKALESRQVANCEFLIQTGKKCGANRLNLNFFFFEKHFELTVLGVGLIYFGRTTSHWFTWRLVEAMLEYLRQHSPKESHPTSKIPT